MAGHSLGRLQVGTLGADRLTIDNKVLLIKHMVFSKTSIDGVFIIDPKILGDQRGYFFESFNQKEFDEKIGRTSFVQDNESKSSYGVLRGLHFQKPPFAQAKLVRCLDGEVLDVAVDLRKGSPTFGRYVSDRLSGENKRQLYIPRGFAHGFVVLSKSAVILYKVDNAYAPDYDTGIIWNDPQLNIDWGIGVEDIILSPKDASLPLLRDTDVKF